MSTTFVYSIQTHTHLTSALEMTHKPSLAEAQNASRKQKIFYMECGYLSHWSNSRKNCFPRKISVKSVNWLLSYGKINNFQYTSHIRYL